MRDTIKGTSSPRRVKPGRSAIMVAAVVGARHERMEVADRSFLRKLVMRTTSRGVGICLARLLLASLPIALPAAHAANDIPPPTLENVSYGPHKRNVLDLW